MYVCLCHGVTDEEVKQSVAKGNRTLRQVSQHLKVGTGCGTCTDYARCLVKELTKENPPEPQPGDDDPVESP
jgi:bacterioferritin-associated ferredoxin